MNPTPLHPRTSGYPSAFSPVPAGTPSAHAVTSLPPDAGIRRYAPAMSVLVDGAAPLDRASLEDPAGGLHVPASTLFASELEGATPFDKGLALLNQVRARKAAGEFSAYQPALLFFHGMVQEGELILTDARGSFQLPAIVLLHALSSELKTPAAAHDPRRPAPIVLSCCFAEHLASVLRDFPRPVLINGSEHELDVLDAQAVFRVSARVAEAAWRADRAVCADELFDALSSTSGDSVHQLAQGEWLTHTLPFSTASLSGLDDSQAAFYLRAMLIRGTADEFAEALLLFGTAPLHRLDPSITPLQYLLEFATFDMASKLQLLLVAGEDADAADDDGHTLLHTVCETDGVSEEEDAEEAYELRWRLARILLAYGADPQVANHAGVTPAELARASGHPALASLFGHDANPGTPAWHQAALRTAALQRGWQSVLSLLANPAQLDDVDDTGFTDDDSEASDRTDDAAMPAQISENSDS